MEDNKKELNKDVKEEQKTEKKKTKESLRDTEEPKKKRKPRAKTKKEAVEKKEEEIEEIKPKPTEKVQQKVLKDTPTMLPEDNTMEQAWYELQNAYVTKRPLTGILSGVEDAKDGGVVVLYYKEHRVIIPFEEMELKLAKTELDTDQTMRTKRRRALCYMIGCEIDFIVMGLDEYARSVVGSRKKAMAYKRHLYYFTNETGRAKIEPDSVVEARVIAVGEKILRLEVFGVECTVSPRDICWEWLGDARERFQVGDRVQTMITQIETNPKTENVLISASMKKLTKNTALENLARCKPHGRYSGKITDIHKGIIFVHLDIGVNAVAYHCADTRFPGKHDRVSMVIHRLDTRQAVAIGIITKIIRQSIY